MSSTPLVSGPQGKALPWLARGMAAVRRLRCSSALLLPVLSALLAQPAMAGCASRADSTGSSSADEHLRRLTAAIPRASQGKAFPCGPETRGVEDMRTLPILLGVSTRRGRTRGAPTSIQSAGMEGGCYRQAAA